MFVEKDFAHKKKTANCSTYVNFEGSLLYRGKKIIIIM